MAKRKLKKDEQVSPILTMRLFDPGMSPLHRAGLGGLACSLRNVEQAHREGALSEEELPGSPWDGDSPPWEIEPLQVTLHFGQPEEAGPFLKRLFELSFRIHQKLIYLPSQYHQELATPVRAELQTALTLTFLQHGKTRTLAKEETPLTYEIDGNPLTVNVRFCSGYKHQDGWKALCDGKGRLKSKLVEVIGPLNPGAVVRHVAFNTQTRIEEPPERIIPLYFALIGCLALAVNRGTGVLLVPEVVDLEAFALTRPFMTPRTMEDCRVTSAGDAALQAQVRLRATEAMQDHEIPACHAYTFRPTPWASQQKSRIDALEVPAGEEERLRLFQIALQELAPRVASRVVKEATGSGKKKEVTESKEWFWSDSVVRPMVADNLALGRRWYQGFVDLMRKIDPVSKRPIRDRLFFEKKGLSAMIEKIPWQDRGESTVVKAVHEAMRHRYGQIADENKGSPVAMKKRWTGEYDRWRLAFAGAKTPNQFRFSLCDLFSRAGVNSILKEQWPGLLPMLDSRHWELTRDLALLALASYGGRGAEEIEKTESNEPTENAN